jgi:hypothetical protein
MTQGKEPNAEALALCEVAWKAECDAVGWSEGEARFEDASEHNQNRIMVMVHAILDSLAKQLDPDP